MILLDGLLVSCMSCSCSLTANFIYASGLVFASSMLYVLVHVAMLSNPIPNRWSDIDF